VHLARADAADGLRVDPARRGDRATLLLAVRVPAWSRHELPATADLAELEAAVRAAAEAEGIALDEPFPFRVRGRATVVRLHVIRGSCPIAEPDGTPPWRHDDRDVPVRLVGFHAQDAVGVLTHHGRDSHVHAVLADGAIAGHLDEVGLAAGAELLLPAR
jgi:acetolactate decarboxylase